MGIFILIIGDQINGRYLLNKHVCCLFILQRKHKRKTITSNTALIILIIYYFDQLQRSSLNFYKGIVVLKVVRKPQSGDQTSKFPTLEGHLEPFFIHLLNRFTWT